MRFTLPAYSPEKPALQDKPLEVVGSGVFEASIQQPTEALAQLTERDRAALQGRYAKINRHPNFKRAARVKALMGQGKTLNQICSVLRLNGKGYGRDSVMRDYWAMKQGGHYR